MAYPISSCYPWSRPPHPLPPPPWGHEILPWLVGGCFGRREWGGLRKQRHIRSKVLPPTTLNSGSWPSWEAKETSFFFFFFWLWPATCGILVPWPGIKPAVPTLEVQSLNDWTTREDPLKKPVITIPRPQHSPTRIHPPWRGRESPYPQLVHILSDALGERRDSQNLRQNEKGEGLQGRQKGLCGHDFLCDKISPLKESWAFIFILLHLNHVVWMTKYGEVRSKPYLFLTTALNHPSPTMWFQVFFSLLMSRVSLGQDILDLLGSSHI